MIGHSRLRLPVGAEVHRLSFELVISSISIPPAIKTPGTNSINYVPAWSSDLKRIQSMAGGMLLTYAYLHALMCRRIPTACSQL
ncbi:unnamed protein product [Schistosoma intercalatum]|nr:unnamed protein product [Schistosoma intercalatum]